MGSARSVSNASPFKQLEQLVENIAPPGRRSVALFSATPGVRTERLATELGLALARLRRERVAVVLVDPAAMPQHPKPDAADVPVEFVAPAELPDPGSLHRVMAPLLSQTRERCAFAIIDASAVRDRAEMLSLSRFSEAVCIVAKSGVTTETELLALGREIGPVGTDGVLICS